MIDSKTKMISYTLKDTEGYDLTINVKKNVNLENKYTDLIQHALDNVLKNNSFSIPNWIVNLNGMSGKKYRNFINVLVSKIENPRYLEIGCWKGSTACSVLYSNNVKTMFVDNWSQFGGPKTEFIDNISKCMNDKNQNSMKIINDDFRKVNFSNEDKYNIFFFDGPHEENDHYDGLVIPYNSLDDEFVFICDDWNWSSVKNGTHKAIQNLELEMLSSIEIVPTKPEGFGLGGEFSDWHNGYFIAVCKKTKQLNPVVPVMKKNKKIVDFFPYFDAYGRELLEFRIKLFQDYVDEFVICESNKTQSGIPIEFNLHKVIEELNLPKEKIRIIQLDIPEDNKLEIQDIDRYNAVVYGKDNMVNLNSLRSRVRERLQKDSLLQVIDEYDDDTVFIFGDSDEIINPQLLSWVPNIVRQTQETSLVRIPLVHLEGRADLRVYDNEHQEWFPWLGLILCTKSQLKKINPHRLRANFRIPLENARLHEKNKMLEDLGWHFSWMGGVDKRAIKANAWAHYNDVIGDEQPTPWSSEEKRKVVGNENLKVGDVAFSGTGNLILKEYPLENLPELIFKLPKVKEFLLPKVENKPYSRFSVSVNTKSKAWIVDDFYSDPDTVRKFALEQQYIEGGFGRGFIGRRTEKQFLFPGLKEKFEEIMGIKIIKWEDHGMNGRFQNCHSGEPLVYHCDDQRWAGMLYLTPNAPYQCGTTLYAHKVSRARSFYDPGWDDSWKKNAPGDPHLDRTPFEPVDVLGNVYNRLVIFDASSIHSASEYFGTYIENSRLWQMFFFD
jgi:hypothetical protein